MALFLNMAKINNRKFREIFAAFSVITAIIAIFGYYQAGMLSMQMLKTSFIFVPILLIGTIVGKKLNAIIPIENFQIFNTVLTLIASILMISL